MVTLMVRNPCVWPTPMNKTTGTPLGEMADQTVVGSVHNSNHGAFASGALCGGSFKSSDSSPLVFLTGIINMSRGQFNVDVAATFRVSLTNVGDLDVLIKDMEAGNHEELLSGITNNMHEAVMDALVAMKVVEMVSTRFANTFYGYFIVWVKIHDVAIQVFSEDGLSIITSQIGFLKRWLSIIVSQIGKPVMLDNYTSSMCIKSWGRSSFACFLIEINAEDILKESLTIGVLLIEDTGFIIKTVSTIEYE
nr:hypothetical protein [Tanacetum cinerariifolium]